MRRELAWRRLGRCILPIVFFSMSLASPAQAAPVDPTVVSPDGSATADEDTQRRVGEQLFTEKIAPIFAERCLSCHSAKKSHGMLRLDARDEALRGGETRGRVTEVDAAQNYLWERVSTTDDEERMPAGEKPLSEEQLADIHRWVELSAPWPSSADATGNRVQIQMAAHEDLPFWLSAVNAAGGTLDMVQSYQAYFPLGYLVVAILSLIALAGRVGRQRTAQGPSCQARAWKVWLMRAASGYFYLASAAALVIFALWLHVGVVEHDKQLVELAKQQVNAELVALRNSIAPQPRSEDPLAAVYPRHPNRIGGTYYRGNDERNPALYNGGDYCTCKFHLGLVDAEKNSLQAGGSVAPGPLSMRLEIERAPFAAEALFSRRVIRACFLSRLVEGQQIAAPADEIHTFTPLAKGQRWEAFYPLDTVLATEGAQEFSGRVFLYNGGAEGTEINGSPHYSIDYQLRIVDGRLTADSDLRMGVIYLATPVVVPAADKVPVDEWFSDRPLPEIVGGNTSDKELLGIKPHEERLGTALEKDEKDEKDENDSAANE